MLDSYSLVDGKLLVQIGRSEFKRRFGEKAASQPKTLERKIPYTRGALASLLAAFGA